MYYYYEHLKELNQSKMLSLTNLLENMYCCLHLVHIVQRVRPWILPGGDALSLYLCVISICNHAFLMKIWSVPTLKIE
jgi:hypothetical protein